MYLLSAHHTLSAIQKAVSAIRKTSRRERRKGKPSKEMTIECRWNEEGVSRRVWGRQRLEPRAWQELVGRVGPGRRG